MRHARQKVCREAGEVQEDTNIAIVHTAGSLCRCAETIADGLHALGYRTTIYNSEDILLEVEAISKANDLVIDHTDTLFGKSALRFAVRMLLEAYGARLVGAGASAAMLADNKFATKKRFISAGIPTPAGITINGKNWEKPDWLTPPLILKPFYEHMSRGICLAEDIEQAHALSQDLLNELKQPVIIEKFIPGREMAVSMIEDVEKGLTMLPPVEWDFKTDERFQTGRSKLIEHRGGRTDVMPAKLSKKELHLLSDFAGTAFRGLDMRDYCRFDIKLSPDGEFFFLEANISPSLERAEAMAISARWAGLSYNELLGRIISSAAKRYGQPI